MLERHIFLRQLAGDMVRKGCRCKENTQFKSSARCAQPDTRLTYAVDACETCYLGVSRPITT